MQVIYIKEDKYQYDIHSLFKAFYPDEDVRVIIGEKGTAIEKEKDVSRTHFHPFLFSPERVVKRFSLCYNPCHEGVTAAAMRSTVVSTDLSRQRMKL